LLGIVSFGNQFMTLPDKFRGFAINRFTGTAVKQPIYSHQHDL